MKIAAFALITRASYQVNPFQFFLDATQQIAFNLYTSRFNFFSRLAIYGGLRKKIETTL
jgi:hypothetical protein